MQVYIHEDGSVSAPFCELGESVANGIKWGGEVLDCCSSSYCTCGNDFLIDRQANEIETANFWKTLREIADAALYESNYNL